MLKSFKEGYWVLLSPTNIGNNTTVEKDTLNNITKQTMFCNKCGTEIQKNSAFCSSCGNKIEQVNNKILNENPKPQNNTVTNETKVNIQNENTTTKNKSSLIIGIIVIIGIIIGVMIGGNNFTKNNLNGIYKCYDNDGIYGQGTLTIEDNTANIRYYSDVTSRLITWTYNITETGKNTYKFINVNNNGADWNVEYDKENEELKFIDVNGEIDTLTYTKASDLKN